jgi:hypothetical protein
MSTDRAAASLLRVELTLLVEVHDAQALRDQALESIDESRYVVTDDGVSPQEAAEEDRAAVRADPADALAELLIPDDLVDGVAGVEARESRYTVTASL